MSYLPGKDVSQWNDYVPGSEDFVMIKMSGGDAGLYLDSKAATHYQAGVNAGKVVGGYHFAGGSDPVAEANYFIKAMSPFAEGDLFALDWEIQHADPVGWCLSFVNEVHAKTNVWPFVYMNISTTNAYNWDSVLGNCGLWLAAPSFTFDANAPVHRPYVMQQGPIVGGIDSDAFFGTREQLLKYGYHTPASPVLAPPPAPTHPPVQPTPSPAPIVTPPPVPTAPIEVPAPPVSPVTPINVPIQPQQGSEQTTNTSPVVVTTPPKKLGFLATILAWIKSLFS